MKRFLFPHFFIFSFLLISCGNSDKPLQEEARIRATANYAKYCAGCHDDDLGWFKNRQWKHGTTRRDIYKSTKMGYPDYGMPSFESFLSDKDMHDLAKYIITTLGSKRTNTGSQDQNTKKAEKFNLQREIVAQSLDVARE